jgi:hypothetical protein
MVLASEKETLQPLEANGVIIHSKNTHANWELISARHAVRSFLHSHILRQSNGEEKRIQTLRLRIEYFKESG